MIRPLGINDIDALRDLFRTFPYKAGQQRFQGIDGDMLADFFTQAESRRFDAPEGAKDRWVGVEDGEIKAFGGLQGDEWHSNFYNMRFGKIVPLLAHKASADLRKELIDFLLAEASRKSIEHLSVRIDGSEFALLHQLHSMGFYLVDGSVKMSAPLSRVPNLAAPSSAGGMSIREYRPEDLPIVKEIAASSHSVNHFYNDPHLGREQTNRLFEGWVEKCCKMPSAMIYILEHRGRPGGFIIYLNPSGFNKAMRTHLVILDFVCLSRAIQGGGIGRWFISQTLKKLGKSFSMVELRTSHNNYPALGCYEMLGMQIISSDFLLHFHYGTR